MGLAEVLAVRPVPFVQIGDGIEPEPVQPEAEPEADDVEHGVAHLWVVVVEIGLVMEEAVPVVLLPLRVPGPVRRLIVDEDHPGIGVPGVVVGPDVPVRLGVRPVPPRLLEPRMLIAGVVDDEVGDHSDLAPVRLLDEHGGVVDGPVGRQHGEEVADVVAAVAKRRLEEGQQPDAVDAEPLEVFELVGDAQEITGPVGVRVIEAADEDLVEDRLLVPAVVVPVDRHHCGLP